MDVPILIIFICFSSTTFAFKIYKSSLEMLNTKQISGLAYKQNINQNVFKTNDFTACIRAKLKRLGIGKDARLLQIGVPKQSELLRLFARDPATWFSFGNPTFASWPLRDPMTKAITYSYFVWKIDVWNHICFSYSEVNSYTSFVKVKNIIMRAFKLDTLLKGLQDCNALSICMDKIFFVLDKIKIVLDKFFLCWTKNFVKG